MWRQHALTAPCACVFRLSAVMQKAMQLPLPRPSERLALYQEADGNAGCAAKHLVLYEDGDKEWLNLTAERVEWEQEEQPENTEAEVRTLILCCHNR